MAPLGNRTPSPRIPQLTNTSITFEVPVIEVATVSFAEMVWFLVVRNVAENTPMPLHD